ncbi:MAG: peptidase [Rubrivivax sp.]|nr:MAG: peptidase [Rubrivivax sp.]
MVFLRRIRQRLRDVATLKALCLRAEQHARQDGHDKPGAEHFLLSALELPDGSARRSFTRLQADPDRFREAMARQYREALQHIGIDSACTDAIMDNPAPATATRLLYEAQPSGQAVIQGLVTQRQLDRDAPLLGAHVVIAVTAMEQGVAARALATMGVDRTALRSAAQAELALHTPD